MRLRRQQQCGPAAPMSAHTPQLGSDCRRGPGFSCMVDLGGQQPRSVQFSQNRAGEEDYAGNASRHYAGTKYYFILQLRVKQGSIAYTLTRTCVSGPANAGTPGFTHMGTELPPPVIADKPSRGELEVVRTPS